MVTILVAKYSGKYCQKILWSYGCIKQWAEDLRTVFPGTLTEMPYIKTFGCIIVQKKCLDNIHSVEDTKVGFQNLPRSDL